MRQHDCNMRQHDWHMRQHDWNMRQHDFNMDQHGGHISFFNSRSINKIANLSRFKVECIKTRCVKFYDKTNKNKILSTVTKIFAELLNIPSQIFGFGHDMIAVLRK